MAAKQVETLQVESCGNMDGRAFVTPVMRLLMCDAVVRMTAIDLRLPKWHVMRSFGTCSERHQVSNPELQRMQSACEL